MTNVSVSRTGELGAGSISSDLPTNAQVFVSDRRWRRVSIATVHWLFGVASVLLIGGVAVGISSGVQPGLRPVEPVRSQVLDSSKGMEESIPLKTEKRSSSTDAAEVKEPEPVKHEVTIRNPDPAVGVPSLSDGKSNVGLETQTAPSGSPNIAQDLGSPTEVQTDVGDEDDGEGETPSEPGDLTARVQDSVKDLPGSISGVSEGSTAVLEGFVADKAERSEAGELALAVPGVESVDNRLTLLKPQVVKVLKVAEVNEPGVVGVGTEITVTGEVESEDAKAAVVGTARAIPGVTKIIDDLTVVSELVSKSQDVETEVARTVERLNALPQVQFDSSSSTISSDSYGDLDKAAELLTGINDDYDGTIEVQSYTETTGNAAANQTLSEERSEAVRAYLIEKGVPEILVASKGFGLSDKFSDDLTGNGLIRFESIRCDQLDGQCESQGNTVELL